MRSNRLLGANLVENSLVKIEDLEKANERFFDLIKTGTGREASILAILIQEDEALSEDVLLSFLVEEEGLALIDLVDVDTPSELKGTIEADACWSTWTVPFDKEGDFYYIATAYYLSPLAREYWEKKLEGHIIWYGTTMSSITGYMERCENEGLLVGLSED